MPSGPLLQSSLLPPHLISQYHLCSYKPPSPAASVAHTRSPAVIIIETPPAIEYQIPSHSHDNSISNPAASMETSISSCARIDSSTAPPVSTDKNDLFPEFLREFTSEYDQFTSLLNVCINLQQLNSDDHDNSTSGSDAANYDRSAISKYDQEVSSMISNQELADTVLSISPGKKASNDNEVNSSQLNDDNDDIDLSACFSAGWRGLKRTRSKRPRSRNTPKVVIGVYQERSNIFNKKKRSVINRCCNSNTSMHVNGRNINSCRSVQQEANATFSSVTSDIASTKYGVLYDNRTDVTFSRFDTMVSPQNSSSTSKLDQLALVACELTNTVSKRRRTPRKRRQHISAPQSRSKINYISTVNGNFIRSDCIVSDGEKSQPGLSSKIQPNYIRRLDQEISALTLSASSCSVTEINLPRLRSMLIKEKKRKDNSTASSSITNSFQKKKITKQRVYSRREKETRIQRCAKRVLDFVGKEVIHEKVIRQTLGNNPDTSKALRLLLNQRKLGRIGAGGRKDPYKYKATQSGLREELSISGISHDIIEERSTAN